MQKEYENELIQNDYLSKLETIRLRRDECGKNISIIQQEAESFGYIGNNISNILDEIRLNNRSDEHFIKNLEMYTSEIEDARNIVERNFNDKYEAYIHEEKELAMYEKNIADEYNAWMNSLELNDDIDII